MQIRDAISKIKNSQEAIVLLQKEIKRIQTKEKIKNTPPIQVIE